MCPGCVLFEEGRRYLQVLRWGQVVLWVPWGPEGKKTDERHNIRVTTYNQFKLHKQRTAIIHIVLFFLGEEILHLGLVHLNSIRNYKNISPALPRSHTRLVKSINPWKFLNGIQSLSHLCPLPSSFFFCQLLYPKSCVFL